MSDSVSDLVAALEPFAKAATDLADGNGTLFIWRGKHGEIPLQYADFRRAASALSRFNAERERKTVAAHMPSRERLLEQIDGDPDDDECEARSGQPIVTDKAVEKLLVEMWKWPEWPPTPEQVRAALIAAINPESET